jgi:hypothetical protein
MPTVFAAYWTTLLLRENWPQRKDTLSLLARLMRLWNCTQLINLEWNACARLAQAQVGTLVISVPSMSLMVKSRLRQVIIIEYSATVST